MSLPNKTKSIKATFRPNYSLLKFDLFWNSTWPCFGGFAHEYQFYESTGAFGDVECVWFAACSMQLFTPEACTTYSEAYLNIRAFLGVAADCMWKPACLDCVIVQFRISHITFVIKRKRKKERCSFHCMCMYTLIKRKKERKKVMLINTMPCTLFYCANRNYGVILSNL